MQVSRQLHKQTQPQSFENAHAHPLQISSSIRLIGSDGSLKAFSDSTFPYWKLCGPTPHKP